MNVQSSAGVVVVKCDEGVEKAFTFARVTAADVKSLAVHLNIMVYVVVVPDNFKSSFESTRGYS